MVILVVLLSIVRSSTLVRFVESKYWNRRERRKNYDHKKSIGKSAECGCFHCLAIFPPQDISEWTDTSETEPRHTALCPKCGIDSVIGSDSGYPITKEFLSSMQQHWFEE